MRKFLRAMVLSAIAVGSLFGGPVAGAAVKTHNEKLLAIAENFEAITDSAFDDSLENLKALASEATASVVKSGDLLGADLKANLEARALELSEALAADDRSRVAIAAVESYRALVSAEDATAKIPPAIKLLDYAGFKYNALLKAKSVDWAAIGDVMTFADVKWLGVSAQISDTKLHDEFAAALRDMGAASQAHDMKAAAAAFKRETDLVDKVEEYFRSKKK